MGEKPRRIRLLCIGRDLRSGGAERVQMALLEQLDRAKVEITLVYLNNGGSLKPIVNDRLSPLFLLPEGISLKRHVWTVINTLRRLARSNDIVFGMQDGAPMYLAALIGIMEHRPAVGWMHNTWTQMLTHDLAFWHNWAATFTFPRMEKIICVSEGVGSDLCTWLPALKSKVISMPNSIKVSEVAEKSNEPLPPWAEAIFSKPTVIGVGRLVPQKRFDVLIEAFAIASGRGLDANLVIIGDGELRTSLNSLISTLKLDTRVFLPGFQLNPYPFFKHAALFASTSDYEGLSMVILEALSLGVPVIATDCPHGPRELLEDGRCGTLIPVRSPAQCADAMSDIIDNRCSSTDRIVRGINRAAAFDAQNAAHRFEALFAVIAENTLQSGTAR